MDAGVVEDSFIDFLPHPRIVAIDNNPSDLDQIAKGLFNAGLPCVTMLYDIAQGLVKPDTLDPSMLRIVFLDLNLGEIENIGSSMGTLTAPICEVLKILSPAGPYLLVFWTKHHSLVKDTMKMIAERGDTDVPLPVSYETLDKDLFTDASKVEELRKGIITALGRNYVFLALLAWESEVEGAAVRTCNRLHNLVAARQGDGTSLNVVDLKDLLKQLAIAAWGKVHAKGNAAASVTSGLLPLLGDHLDAITNNPAYSKIWDSALSNGWNRGMPSMVTPAQMNAQCLVDLSCSDMNCRGAWLEFIDDVKKPDGPVKSHLGQGIEDLTDEFINPDAAKDLENFRSKVSLGLLECSAACDLAQNKAPLRRYILCARMPADFEKYRTWENPVRKKKHEAIFELEKVRIGSEDFDLLLDFRYTLSLPPDHPLTGPQSVKAAFRVRSQVLAHITAHFAFYTSRPGTFSFRP